MIVVQQYLYLPGCCTFCNGVSTPVIDTGIDLDHPNDPHDPNPSAIRRLYICADCAINFATMVRDARGLEFHKAGYKGSVEATIDSLTESNVDLANRVTELENALRVVKSIPPSPSASEVTSVKKFKVVDDPKENSL